MATNKHPVTKLCREARELWADLQREFTIDDEAGRRLLLTACEALHRMRAAEAQIARDGLTQLGKDAVIRRNPAVGIARDERNAMLAAFQRHGVEHVRCTTEGHWLRQLSDFLRRPVGRA